MIEPPCGCREGDAGDRVVVGLRSAAARQAEDINCRNAGRWSHANNCMLLYDNMLTIVALLVTCSHSPLFLEVLHVGDQLSIW